MDQQQANAAPVYTTELISRLLTAYLGEATLPDTGTPLSVPLVQRLMRAIIAEGYGASARE